MMSMETLRYVFLRRSQEVIPGTSDDTESRSSATGLLDNAVRVIALLLFWHRECSELHHHL